jgi:23S rRNA (uridine2552-2'-O)-methyltransferase
MVQIKTAKTIAKKARKKHGVKEDKKLLIVGGGETKFKKQMNESSKKYLIRQASDRYVKKAIAEGYHSRAAYKLKQINAKTQIIKPGQVVVDLGAAPGGWCQVIKEEMSKGGRTLGGGKIFALDKVWMHDITEVNFIKGDFTKDEVYEELLDKCPNKVDVVLSDMAPETSGHEATDHVRIMGLVEMAAEFAYTVLKKDGTFMCKIFHGGEEVKFTKALRERFSKVKYEKPDSSRKGSAEMFILCTGFKG